MSNDAWHARWRENRIGFHRSEVHPLLDAHWPPPGVAADAAVFVPLAGKSLDMHWLAERGHAVIGVELSPIAVQGFFDEAGVTPAAGTEAGIDYLEHGRIRLYIGDLFALRPAHLLDATACYDRASLVALDAPTRRRYAEALAALLPGGAGMLLVTVDYPRNEMSGPPFAVPDDEVLMLFGSDFEVLPLGGGDVLDKEPRFRERGLTRMRESAWQLRRRDQK
jgi:thiopurine S-methyltransferase